MTNHPSDIFRVSQLLELLDAEFQLEEFFKILVVPGANTEDTQYIKACRKDCAGRTSALEKMLSDGNLTSGACRSIGMEVLLNDVRTVYAIPGEMELRKAVIIRYFKRVLAYLQVSYDCLMRLAQSQREEQFALAIHGVTGMFQVEGSVQKQPAQA